jgi:hypothetical protein
MVSVGQRSMSAVVAMALALAVLAPGVAGADAPSRLVGTVTEFHGKYGLVVRDARGRVVDVALHPGTVIKPAGLRLERGMIVTILGQAADRTFAAGEIDTAYQLPPARVSKGSSSVAVPADSPFVPRPAADNGRFNNIPGDLNAPRVPDTLPATGSSPPR